MSSVVPYKRKLILSLVHSEGPKLYGVLAALSAVGMRANITAFAEASMMTRIVCFLTYVESVYLQLVPWYK